MGCACLFALLAAGLPRLAFIFLWLFTPRVTLAFRGSLIVPLLGLLFLPLTSVIYALVSLNGLSVIDWFLLIVGFLIDLGSYGSGAYGRGKR
jgi:hypothetical protein